MNKISVVEKENNKQTDYNENQTFLDPKKYSIKRVEKSGDYLIVKINYLDNKEFDGNRILVFKDCTIAELATQGTINPVFSEKKDFIYPIAMFRPDSNGWELAEAFVYTLKLSQQQLSSS